MGCYCVVDLCAGAVLSCGAEVLDEFTEDVDI
jgi:hypothetical protein